VMMLRIPMTTIGQRRTGKGGGDEEGGAWALQ